MIMEAEKSHGLLSASWRPREDSGVQPVHAKSQKAPRTREADDSLSLEQERTNVPAQSGRENAPFLSLFVQALN